MMFFLNFYQFESNGKLFLDNIAAFVHNVFFAYYFS